MIPGTMSMMAASAPSYATFNPLDKHANITLSNGNRTASCSAGAGWFGVRATSFKTAGKWLFEVIVEAGGAHMMVGVATSSASLATFLGAGTTSWGYYSATGNKIFNDGSGVGVAYGSTWVTNGDRIWTAFDIGTGELWWAKNGTWQASGDPDAATNEAYTGVTGSLYPIVAINDQGTDPSIRINCGQEAFYSAAMPTTFNKFFT